MGVVELDKWRSMDVCHPEGGVGETDKCGADAFGVELLEPEGFVCDAVQGFTVCAFFLDDNGLSAHCFEEDVPAFASGEKFHGHEDHCIHIKKYSFCAINAYIGGALTPLYLVLKDNFNNKILCPLQNDKRELCARVS